MKKKGEDIETNAFINQLKKSKRFKFPWSLNEVKGATEYFKDHINGMIE